MWPVPKRREGVPRSVIITTLTLATVSAMALAFLWSEAPAGALAQDDSAGSCGAPATGWSNATVNGFSGTVTAVTREPDAVGAATPPAADRLVATLAFTNESDEVISLGAGTTVALLTCDGHVLSPSAGARIDPETLTMAPGAELEIPFTFILPAGTEPERIVVRIEPDGRCLGQLGFPLAIQIDATATATATASAEGETPETAIFATCAGGSATTGAAASGTDGTGGPGTPAADTGKRGTQGGGATAGGSTG